MKGYERVSRTLLFLTGFMYFWSIVFFFTTTLVMLLKHENSEGKEDHEQSKGVLSTYKLLWKIVRLPSVLQYVVILLTCKVRLSVEVSSVIFILGH